MFQPCFLVLVTTLLGYKTCVGDVSRPGDCENLGSVHFQRKKLFRTQGVGISLLTNCLEEEINLYADVNLYFYILPAYCLLNPMHLNQIQVLRSRTSPPVSLATSGSVAPVMSQFSGRTEVWSVRHVDSGSMLIARVSTPSLTTT